jgi:hypothetical protein
MCANWKKEYDRALLLTGLESIRTTDASGRAAFTGHKFDNYITVLQSSVDFSTKIPEAERRRIVYGSVFAMAQANKLTKEAAIIAEISKRENEYLRQPQKQFVLVTSLSIRYFKSLTPKQVHGAKITFSSYLPKYFDRADLLERAQHNGVTPPPRDYTQVRISVRGRSDYEAVTLALDAFDLIRGIWNIALNHTLVGRSGSGKITPVNRIIPGPIHTLHEPKGKPATDTYWHEPSFPNPAFNAFYVQGDWKQVQEIENEMRTRLAKKSYRADIEDAIRGYTRALDLRDFNTAFLALWGLLEKLTSTLLDTYKITIRRTLFLFQEREYHQQILNHLRNYRNRAVHAGEETEEIETLLIQLKFYVEQLLFFHIYNKLGFSSMPEAAEFMDLPHDTSVLKKQIKLLEKAVRFHKA